MAEPRPDVGATSLTLLDRARANEADAWARLVTLYAPLVRHWCLAGELQPNDVDDVVQEVCRGPSRGWSASVAIAPATPSAAGSAPSPGPPWPSTSASWPGSLWPAAAARRSSGSRRSPTLCPTRWIKTPPTRSGGCIAAPWSWSAASSRIVPGRCSGSRPSKTASRPRSPPGSESPPWPSARPSRASSAGSAKRSATCSTDRL